jgi:hypothetical protein
MMRDKSLPYLPPLRGNLIRFSGSVNRIPAKIPDPNLMSTISSSAGEIHESLWAQAFLGVRLYLPSSGVQIEFRPSGCGAMRRTPYRATARHVPMKIPKKFKVNCSLS